MMLIAHLMGANGLYTKDLYKFISRNFPLEEHCFITDDASSSKFNLDDGPGCAVYSMKTSEGFRKLQACDFVIAHGIVSSRILGLLFLQPWLAKKLVWVAWGGDIYYRETEPDSLKKSLVEGMRKSLYPKIRFIGTVSSKDFPYIQQHYGSGARTFEVTYPVGATDLSALRAARQIAANRTSDAPVVIQVGNSATRSNDHFAALEALAHLAEENILIHLPLSYGGEDHEEYAKEVVAYAESLFPGKVRALTDTMPSDEYLKLLGTVDVGVFANTRQQGMGNITQLILCGAKVFLRSEVSMWDHLSGLGCRLNDFSLIESASLHELIYEPAEDKQANIAVFERRHGVELKVEQWGRLFEALRQECKHE